MPFGSYTVPTSVVSRLVDNVVSQGSVLNLTDNAPCSNCSYSVEFYGPTLQSNQLPTSTTAWIAKLAYNLSSTATFTNYQQGGFDAKPLYAAFVPSSIDDNANLTANMIEGLNDLYTKNYPLTSLLDEASTDYQKLFIYHVNGNTSSTLQCGLYNASYKVDFNLNNGAQSVSLRNITYLNGVTYMETSPYILLYCYQQQKYCGTETTNSIPTASYTTSVLNNAAYQAMMNALNTIFVGHIDNLSINLGALVTNTRVLSSSLSTTPELQPLSSLFGGSNSTSNTSLSQAIEELSHSITISLFSSPKFL